MVHPKPLSPALQQPRLASDVICSWLCLLSPGIVCPSHQGCRVPHDPTAFMAEIEAFAKELGSGGGACFPGLALLELALLALCQR